MSITLSQQTGSTLTSVSRLTQNAQLSALNTSNPTLVASLLAAATGAIQRETHRDLIWQSYTEYDSGGNYPYNTLILQNYPVTAVTRVATNPQTVLKVANTNTSLNQRATIATTTGGVMLYLMQSGVPTTSTLLYTTYPTITLLANAITALGNGFSATVMAPFGNHPSVDLRPLQGAYSTLNGGAELQMFTEELSSSLSLASFADDGFEYGGVYGWRMDEGSGILHGRFPRGTMNVRVDYSAGYTVIPDDLQAACVQLVLDFYNTELTDQMQISGKLGPYSFTRDAMSKGMSAKVKQMLETYKDHGRLNLVR